MVLLNACLLSLPGGKMSVFRRETNFISSLMSRVCRVERVVSAPVTKSVSEANRFVNRLTVSTRSATDTRVGTRVSVNERRLFHNWTRTSTNENNTGANRKDSPRNRGNLSASGKGTRFSEGSTTNFRGRVRVSREARDAKTQCAGEGRRHLNTTKTGTTVVNICLNENGATFSNDGATRSETRVYDSEDLAGELGGGRKLNGSVARDMVPENEADPERLRNAASTAEVYVSNLDKAVGWFSVRRVFAVAGQVLFVQLKGDVAGRSRGCATVRFRYRAEAERAVAMLNGQVFHNRRMGVRLRHQSSNNQDSRWQEQTTPASSSDQPPKEHRTRLSNSPRRTESVLKEVLKQKTKGKTMHKHSESSADALEDTKSCRGVSSQKVSLVQYNEKVVKFTDLSQVDSTCHETRSVKECFGLRTQSYGFYAEDDMKNYGCDVTPVTNHCQRDHFKREETFTKNDKPFDLRDKLRRKRRGSSQLFPVTHTEEHQPNAPIFDWSITREDDKRRKTTLCTISSCYGEKQRRMNFEQKEKTTITRDLDGNTDHAQSTECEQKKKKELTRRTTSPKVTSTSAEEQRRAAACGDPVLHSNVVLDTENGSSDSCGYSYWAPPRDALSFNFEAYQYQKEQSVTSTFREKTDTSSLEIQAPKGEVLPQPHERLPCSTDSLVKGADAKGTHTGVSSTTSSVLIHPALQRPFLCDDSSQRSFESAKVEILRALPKEYMSKNALTRNVDASQGYQEREGTECLHSHLLPQSPRVSCMQEILNARILNLPQDGYLTANSVPVHYDPRWFQTSDESSNTISLSSISSLEPQDTRFSISRKMLMETERLARGLRDVSSFQDMASSALVQLNGQSSDDLHGVSQAARTIYEALHRASAISTGLSLALSSNMELCRRRGVLEGKDLDPESKRQLMCCPIGDCKEFDDRVSFAKDL